TMKSISFKLLLILPLLLLTVPSSGATTPVLDVDGSPVTAGTAYLIIPVKRGNGWPLSLGAKNTSFYCPLYIAQQSEDVSTGLPTLFYPVNSTATTVTLSTDMNVEFNAVNVCPQSTVWKLGGVEEESRRYVQSGGVKGNPGIKTLSNWFKIEKDSNSKYYKLVFCPTVCNYCKVVCGDLGFVGSDEDDKRILALGPDIKPLLVTFKLA
ncbi:Kunitz-type protease inhibitor, partial [Paucibacter sp. DJ4R-1]|nr:Kunitz-type protease inhibitor [Paucibacter sp. DJ4R-1]